MTSSGGHAKPRAFAAELDVLRGFAAMLMIFNHSGFRLLAPDDVFRSASAVAVFLGGMAPVLFFFATGFGIALSTHGRARPLDKLGLLWKAFLLVLADQFFFWSKGVAWGVDFFSYIAIATVVVSLIARLKRSMWVCGVLIAVLLSFRYLAGESLQPLIRNHDFAVWMLGVKGIVDISYPLSPWMVYPLLGFVLGSLYGSVRPHAPRPRNRWIQSGMALTVLFLAASVVMHHEKAIFFRWGAMTAGYFVLSLSVLFASALLALFCVMRSERLSAWVSLRGVASFAVIPLHYSMLDAAAHLISLPQPQWVVVMLTLAILVTSFIASNWFAAAASGSWVAAHRNEVFVFALVLVITCVTLALISFNYETVPVEVSRLFGQLFIAILLGLGIPKLGAAVPRVK
jgi:Heparan-alpha-glucosaminide N-acetyltransferase, catalytic